MKKILILSYEDLVLFKKQFLKRVIRGCITFWKDCDKRCVFSDMISCQICEHISRMTLNSKFAWRGQNIAEPWDFFGRNDAEAEAPVLWPPHAKSWLIGKDSDAGRDWGQEEKGTTQDEMAGWHHWLDGCESEWTSGDGDGQGGLACCDSWGRKESDTTEQLNWTELSWPNWVTWPSLMRFGRGNRNLP